LPTDRNGQGLLLKYDAGARHPSQLTDCCAHSFDLQCSLILPPRDSATERDSLIFIRHPEALGATRRASKDEWPRFGPPSFEAHSLRSLTPQDDGSRWALPARRDGASALPIRRGAA
jgi:hypothetical protein